MNNTTKQTLKLLPAKPGCYLFFDANNQILYVGKAKILKNRVRSYFAKNAQLSPAKELMVASIDHIEYITVKNETESSLLERTLIQKHTPPYNVVMKNNNNFFYIHITDETYPRIITTRTVTPRKGVYFGPYSSVKHVKHTLRMLRRVFPFRVSKHHDFVFDVLHAGATIDPTEYQQTIKHITSVLKGQTQTVLRYFKSQMKSASRRKQYEQAASFRDACTALMDMSTQQHVITPQLRATDVIAWTSFESKTYLAILKIRHGRLVDKLTTTITGIVDTDTDTIRQLLAQLYLPVADTPAIIVLPTELNLTQQEQTDIFKQSIKLIYPQRGRYKQLLNIAQLNADQHAIQSQPTFVAAKNITGALKNLRAALSALQPKLLRRIECFDISNIQGSHPVGSMVVFTDGEADKSAYRRFAIKYTNHTPNDFAMMAEVLGRRFRHPDWPLPDLVIIDGGKGQLSSVTKTLAHLNVTVPIVALAKKHEELFIPGQSQPIIVPKKSPEYFLLQRIRDEAHRFAITYYRLKHNKSYTRS